MDALESASWPVAATGLRIEGVSDDADPTRASTKSGPSCLTGTRPSRARRSRPGSTAPRDVLKRWRRSGRSLSLTTRVSCSSSPC